MRTLIDLCLIGILLYGIMYLLSNKKDSSIVSFQPKDWSGDDTLKVMIVKDSAYIVKR